MAHTTIGVQKCVIALITAVADLSRASECAIAPGVAGAQSSYLACSLMAVSVSLSCFSISTFSGVVISTAWISMVFSVLVGGSEEGEQGAGEQRQPVACWILGVVS
jgi:hypothetical protein